MKKTPQTNASYLMPTYKNPSVTLVSGSGARVTDDAGKDYIDFLSGLAVTSLGHSHPAIATAVSEQAQKLLHVSNIFGNEYREVLAEALNRLITSDSTTSGKTFLCNSGTEANEAAIKLARKYGAADSRNTIISTWRGYHGRSLGSLAATGQPKKWEGFGPLPEGFRHVTLNNSEELLAAVDNSVVAIFLEPIQAEGGVYSATPEFFQTISSVCKEREILLIVDEVQTGMARTGAWFGFQHYGVQPDIVTVAKALGNGFPIGACWARDEVAATFSPGDHGSTFGGQPLAASAALAVIETMESLGLPTYVRKRSVYLRTALQKLSGVTEVRGEGLLLAVEFEEEKSVAVMEACLEAGLIVNAVTPQALRLAPPLIITEEDIDEAVGILAQAIETVWSNS